MITEFQSVKINGNVYDLDVHDLYFTDWKVDHDDEYGFGESADVITGIDFDFVVIHLYGGQIEVDSHNEHWESVKKDVTEHILADREFMIDFQNREL